MVKPSPAERPSGSEVARFLTRKLLFVVLLLFVASYIIYSHSSEITSEISTYVPTIPHPPIAPKLRPDAQDTAEADGPARKPPSDFNPHSRENVLYLDLVKEFWKPWANLLWGAKPRIEGITPRHAASNIEVNAALMRKPRTPPLNYIDLSNDDIARLKDEHKRFKDGVERYDPKQELNTLWHHRGVVVVGGGEYMGPAIVSIKMLRATGSDLPVEVFVANWEEYEAEICEEYLPFLNARCLVLSEFVADHGDMKHAVGHYQLKVLALLFCTFRNVLLIDSDSIPLVDPAKLFDSRAYAVTGFLSWPDFWAATESPLFYNITGLPGFPDKLAPTSSEAGQVVISKQRHMHTIMQAVYYNVWGPMHYYPLLSQGSLGQGDKNTFESAAIVQNQAYYRVPKPVEDVGRYTGGENVGFKGSGMVQYMPEADVDEHNINDPTVEPKSTTPAFVHANTPKMNAGHLVDEGDLTSSDGKALRLWGTKEEQEKIFGKDLEKEVWQVVRDTGCDLANRLKEWKDRKDMCDRLNKHWDAVFANA